MAIEACLFGDDRQPEVEREDDAAERAVVLGDEVVERGHHAVARAALVLGVVQLGVHPSAAEQLRPAALACPFCGTAGGTRRGSARLVVEVAAPVRPADVVQDQQGQRIARRCGPTRASTRSSL